MKTLFAALVVSGVAFAQAPAPAPAPKAAPAPAAAPAKQEPAAAAAAPAAPAMDMSKMGPWSRKPTNEKATKKEVDEFFKKEDELAKAGDMNGMLDRVDFPVWMATDDSKGDVEAKPWDKDAYIKMMKPFYENMPKDAKTTHKVTSTVLSDSMVAVTDDFNMSAGKQKMAGRNSGLLVKVGGAWKWKMMAEAGWGGMGNMPEHAAAAPAPAAPAAKPAAPAPAPAPAAAPKK